MAKFKLSYLSPSFEVENKYLCQDISNFFDQLSSFGLKQDFSNNKNFCYSFDENLSIHKNVEKELSFSMLQKSFNDFFEWVENPFTNLLQVGSLVLLTDKHDKTYLFIVKNISYKFLEHNIEYKYTCQDFFSYRFSRMANGYTIKNDATTSDFIGSKTIDWWIEKIHDDCNIDYKYITTSQGLCIYQDSNGQSIGVFNSEEELESNNRSVVKILKYCDNSTHTQDTFPFNVSGSNAKAALISATEQIGYMINAYEYWDENTSTLINYYWTEPQKNNRYTGLSYSPFNDVQDFSLSLSGDNLTTVLNVESVTKDDEELTLIPEISPLFTDYINTDEWDKSEYREGMFTDILDGKTDVYSFSDSESLSSSCTFWKNEVINNWDGDIDVILPDEAYDIKSVWTPYSEFYTNYLKNKLSNYKLTLAITNANRFMEHCYPAPIELIGNSYQACEFITPKYNLEFNLSPEIITPNQKVFNTYCLFVSVNENCEGQITIQVDEKEPYEFEFNKSDLITYDNTAIPLLTETLYTLSLQQNENDCQIIIKNLINNEIYTSTITDDKWDNIKITLSKYVNFHRSWIAYGEDQNLWEYNCFACKWKDENNNEKTGYYDEYVKNYKFIETEGYQEGVNVWTTSNLLFLYGQLTDRNKNQCKIDVLRFKQGCWRFEALFNDSLMPFDLLDVLEIQLHNPVNDPYEMYKWQSNFLNTLQSQEKYFEYNFNDRIMECYYYKLPDNATQKDGGSIFETSISNYLINPYYNLLNFDKHFFSYVTLQDEQARLATFYVNQANLSYVKIIGYQYTSLTYNHPIDLGFKPTATMISELEFSYNEQSEGGVRFYGYGEGDKNDYRFFVYNKKEYYFDIGGVNNEDRIVATGIPINQRIIVQLGNYYLKYNEDIYSKQLEIPSTVSFNQTMKLFDEKDFGTIYSLKVYDGKIKHLIHHFIPFKTVNEQVGLYDLCTDNFIAVPDAILDDDLISPKEVTREYQFNYNNILPSEIKNNYGNLIMRYIFPNSNSTYTLDKYNINLTQYTNTTEEDKLFAQVADQCPWLENILINFNYFLDNKILDKVEYNSLLNIFKNRLRIINGKLLFYSKEYFNALRQKTKIVADLLSKTDTLGVWVKNNIIDPYQLTGIIEPKNDFQTMYNQTLITNLNSTNKYPLMNLDDTITEYFNKYFKSQQRYLKNIYNFKNYFNQLNRYSNLVRHEYTLTFKSSNDSTNNIVWNYGEWKEKPTDLSSLNLSNTILALKNNNAYEKIHLVTDSNKTNYYIINNPTYTPIDKFYTNKEVYEKNGNEFKPITRENLFAKYLDQKKSQWSNYYCKTSEYRQFNKRFNAKSVFDNGFFFGPHINYSLHNSPYLINEFNLSNENGRKNVARCYITNLPVPQLYCKVKHSDDYEEYQPIQYIGNTWSGEVSTDFFTSPRLRDWTAINNLTKQYDYVNTHYRRVGSDPADFKLDTTGWPLCYLTDTKGNQITQPENWFIEGLCDYWKLENITRGNCEDCDGAMFASTNNWPDNFNWSAYDGHRDTVSPVEYDEYYSKIITTYNYAGCNRYFKDTYWRFVLKNENLKPGTTYYKINWNNLANINKMNEAPKNLTASNRISATEFYFFKEYFEIFTVSKEQTIADYFDNSLVAYDWGQGIYYKQGLQYYSIFVAEDFDTVSIEEIQNASDTNPIKDLLNSYTIWYDKTTHEPVDWTQDGEFLSTHYYRDPTSYDRVTNESSSTEYYYKTNNDEYKRAYTISQLKSTDIDWYYLDSNTKIQHLWQNTTSINLYPLLQHITTTDDNVVKVNYYESPTPVVLEFDNDGKPSENKTNVSIKLDDITYTGELTCDHNSNSIQPFATMSNGEFWYTNHSKTDDPILFQEAAVIETQLTQYWTVAYNASLNCEYVLPEYWQLTINGSENHFKKLLYNIDVENNHIRLNPILLPNISVLPNLPTYEFHYSSTPVNIDDQNISLDNVKSNFAIFNALKYINKDNTLFKDENWYLTDTGSKTSYYYVDDGSGMEWCRFPNYILKTAPIYDELSGNYVVLLRHLLRYYQQRTDLKYEELKREQQAIWYTLTHQYANIILQNSFTPTDATTSEDVMFLAQNALKDLSQTERQYNITLLENKISNFRLNNYQQQELHIGDPIAIKASDYYHQYDNIYNILKSYLFISDISYKLREDSSLKLTVNNLKYQDKLIQSLVKLIR